MKDIEEVMSEIRKQQREDLAWWYIYGTMAKKFVDSGSTAADFELAAKAADDAIAIAKKRGRL